MKDSPQPQHTSATPEPQQPVTGQASRRAPLNASLTAQLQLRDQIQQGALISGNAAPVQLMPKKKKVSVFDQHIRDTSRIIADFKSGAKRRVQRRNKKTRRMVWRNVGISKAQNTEAVGEYTTALAVQKHYKGAKMLEGFSPGVGIDQIWQWGDSYLIVEAKGPGAKLGYADGVNAKQMSTKWVLDRLRFVKKKSLRDKIYDAQKAGKMLRVVGYASKKGKSARLEEL